MQVYSRLLLFSIITFLSVTRFVYSQSGPLNGSGGGIIAFTSDRDGQKEIYLMNADGGAQTRVTNNNAFEFDLSWSPDGNRLAFCSNITGGFDIYIMDAVDITRAQFNSPVRITNNNAMETSISWSPDGSRIVYDSGLTGISIMNADGSNSSLLDTSPVNGFQPAWSPQGDRIAFASSQGIYTIYVDGTNLQQLTSTYSLVPAWSPDGSKIAYVATSAAEDIFIMNNNGTGNRRITTNPDNDFVPSWSPDGSRIVYEGSINGNDEICIIDTNGANYIRLTQVGTNTGPRWRPTSEPATVNEVSSFSELPNSFTLYQNYPNPFNPATTISYSIASQSYVELNIYDIVGNRVNTFINKTQSPGIYKVLFNAYGLTSGIYFYTIETSSGISVMKKMILLK